MTTITFKVRANTQLGETVKIVGSDGCLGSWNVKEAAPLQTTPDEYPLWMTEPLRVSFPFEYKYIKVGNGSQVIWESGAINRTVPVEGNDRGQSSDKLIVDDGDFNVVSEPYVLTVYSEGIDSVCPGSSVPADPTSKTGFRVMVFGSSISAGCRASHFRGWAEMLGEALHSRYGHGFSNVSMEGINTSRALDLFHDKVTPLKPYAVILSFELGNEGFLTCAPHERAHVCQGFLGRISQLIAEVHQLGALPILGGVHPHGDYSADHFKWVKKTAEEMRQLNVPVLEWLDALALPDDSGRWDSGVSFDPSHPNTEGHRRMFAGIDVRIFEANAVKAQKMARLRKIIDFGRFEAGEADAIFNKGGFKIFSSVSHDERCEIGMTNASEGAFAINPDWQELKQSLQTAKEKQPGILKPGVYIAAANSKAPSDAPSFLAVDSHGQIANRFVVPASCELKFQHTSSLFRPSSTSQVLFYDGNLALIQEQQETFIVLNESNASYDVHPMWQELRLASRKLPYGLYDDGTEQPFTSALITEHGLSSRVKVLPRSGLRLRFKKELDKVERVALLPIGDRCSVRMLLHKIEYDGPCYPFDLARSTAMGDVSDILRHNFEGLWDPSQLVWDGRQSRLFHRKWRGVSFAHEHEQGENGRNLGPVFDRMAKRYSGRAARFNYACKHATRVLFVRTGCASRAEVEDLLDVLTETFKVRPELLLISQQSSDEFKSIEGVTHICEYFDPDRMYADEHYWLHCANEFRRILERAGVTTANLYWCPNDLKEAEKEAQEAQELSEPPPQRLAEKCVVKKLSHSDLFDIEVAPSQSAVVDKTVGDLKGGYKEVTLQKLERNQDVR